MSLTLRGGAQLLLLLADRCCDATERFVDRDVALDRDPPEVVDPDASAPSTAPRKSWFRESNVRVNQSTYVCPSGGFVASPSAMLRSRGMRKASPPSAVSAIDTVTGSACLYAPDGTSPGASSF